MEKETLEVIRAVSGSTIINGEFLSELAEKNRWRKSCSVGKSQSNYLTRRMN